MVNEMVRSVTTQPERSAAAALGEHARRTSRRRPGDQVRAPPPHRGLRPDAWRRSSRSSRSASRSGSRRSRRPCSTARTSGPWSSTPTSSPARVSAADLALLQRRGCLVVRGHFPREQALGWDRDIVDYVDRNRFFETYRGPADDFFGSVGSKPEIYPIYWSHAQMEARQNDRMARVQSFLNAQWRSSRRASSGSTPTATRSTPTASAAGPRAPTPAAWVPTSTRAPSTSG